MTANDFVSVLILFALALAGGSIYYFKPDGLITKIGSLNEWLIAKYERAREASGHFNQFVAKPLLWGLTRIMAWTEGIQEYALRSGLWLGKEAGYDDATLSVAVPSQIVNTTSSSTASSCRPALNEGGATTPTHKRK